MMAQQSSQPPIVIPSQTMLFQQMPLILPKRDQPKGEGDISESKIASLRQYVAALNEKRRSQM